MAARKYRIGPIELGLKLSGGADDQVFKWLIACQLFGARISQELAAGAFRAMDKAGLLTPRKLAKAEWQRLVDLLDEGGYTRLDESTARALIHNGQLALDRYDGRLSRLPDGVGSRQEVADRLQEFKGVGPKASEIFLRELADVWSL